MQSKYSYFQIDVSTSHFCSHFIFIPFPHSTKYQEVIRTVTWQLTIMNLQGQNLNSRSRNCSGKHSKFFIIILFLFMFLRKHFYMGIEDEWVTWSEWNLAKYTGVCPILGYLCSLWGLLPVITHVCWYLWPLQFFFPNEGYCSNIPFGVCFVTNTHWSTSYCSCHPWPWVTSR